MEEIREEVFIGVAVELEGGLPVEQSLGELTELLEVSGGKMAATISQKRERPHPGHYIGKGKVEELKDCINFYNATGIVCDDELSNTQIRNLSEMLDVKVLDRTLVILDIFAGRAASMEGKLQVELALQRYRLSHLTGLGKSLSRLGGGIGTRGPGEKKLETDRRHIRSRIQELEFRLDDVESHRKLLQEKRERQGQIVISLVGYTNAGKSTLLNYLTGAEVAASSQLFQTLDTTSRSVGLGGSSEAILTDTVGFIHKLPHSLIKAFRSTLGQLKYSDVIIHVVDAQNPARATHMEVVYNTLAEIPALDKPIITVFNKMDTDVEFPLPFDKYAGKIVKLSAKTGEGTDSLILAIDQTLKDLRKKVNALIPYSQGALIDKLRRRSEILAEEYGEDGLLIEAYVDDELYNRLSVYRNMP